MKAANGHPSPKDGEGPPQPWVQMCINAWVPVGKEKEVRDALHALFKDHADPEIGPQWGQLAVSVTHREFVEQAMAWKRYMEQVATETGTEVDDLRPRLVQDG